MTTILTDPALKELETLLEGSRRDLAAVYREWRAGLTPQDMATSRGHHDLKKVKSNLASLRILFGREELPKVGKGRQGALYEAHFWLNSDEILSPELTRHFEKLLFKGEKTNTRRSDMYEPLHAPENRSVYEQARDNTREGDVSGVYVLSRKLLVEEHKVLGKDLIVKLGWSHNVWDRLSNAQTWDHEKLEVLRVYSCKSPNFYEARFHIVLDTLGLSLKSDGGKEWFTVKNLNIIDSIAESLELETVDLNNGNVLESITDSKNR